MKFKSMHIETRCDLVVIVITSHHRGPGLESRHGNVFCVYVDQEHSLRLKMTGHLLL